MLERIGLSFYIVCSTVAISDPLDKEVSSTLLLKKIVEENRYINKENQKQGDEILQELKKIHSAIAFNEALISNKLVSLWIRRNDEIKPQLEASNLNPYDCAKIIAEREDRQDKRNLEIVLNKLPQEITKNSWVCSEK